jgi:6-phospho-beta-glucosidase
MTILDGIWELIGAHITPERTSLNTLGLNHLSWHRGFSVDGEDIWPEVIEATLTRLRSESEPEWDPRTIEVLGMLPNYYLQYFYYTDRN